MAFADPQSLHNPATGTSPPATWGDQVRDNDMYLYERGPYICTAATRPGSPFEGQLIYQTDTNTYLSYDGAGWWTVGRAISTATSYTPVVTQGVSTVDTTAGISEYSICDGWCEYAFNIDCDGAGGSGGSAVLVSIPVTAAAAGIRPVGSGHLFEDSGNLRFSGTWHLQSTSTIAIITDGTGHTSYWGVTPTTGLTSGCSMSGVVRYRIASAA